MAENPLLPDAELRALHALVKRCLTLDSALGRRRQGAAAARSSATLPPSREALLAGTAIHLRPGDLLVTQAPDPAAEALAPGPTESSEPSATLFPDLPKASSRLLLATAMAAALRGSGSDRLVLALFQAGAPEPNWASALAWAQERQLALILACADARGTAGFAHASPSRPESLDWDTVQRTASRLKLPILSVDGEDAVAVYRVMQESVLRARAGAGPALLWVMLPGPRDLAAGRKPAQQPLKRLERYLKVRGIQL